MTENLNASKRVFISHSSKDSEFAAELARAIEKELGRANVWIDLFNLSAGDELVPSISKAIRDANWFILLLSEASVKSRWVRHEANLATFMQIEKEDYRILTIKLDDCSIPAPLDVEIKSRKYVDSTIDRTKAIYDTVSTIAQENTTRSVSAHVFFDRGNEIDEIQLAAESFMVICLLGLQGIGKTTLVEELARTRFSRPLSRISIRSAHDAELLSRQIIHNSKKPQPDHNTHSSLLMDMAIEAVKEGLNQNGAILFIDDAENAIGDDGKFRNYLNDFIDRYINTNPGFPLIIASGRQPELSIKHKTVTLLKEIKPLPDDFMVPCIQRWYALSRGQEKVDIDEIKKIAPRLGGHPLAARLIASEIAFGSIPSLDKFLSGFKFRIAEYLLHDILPRLDELDRVILESIAVTQTGISTDDILAIDLIQKHSLDEVHTSINKMFRRLLLTSEMGLLKLHPFLIDFFERQAHFAKRYRHLAIALGRHFLTKTKQALRDLEKIGHPGQQLDDAGFIRLNQRLFRYAVPAHRLLMIAGENEKADEIPYRLQGHVRELVFVMYQRFEDYDRTIEYANQWLSIDKDDPEIKLYKARALRQLARYPEASRQLNDLRNQGGSLLQAQIERENGLIARGLGKLSKAIEHFRAAADTKTKDGRPLYPISLVDLASALIDFADEMGVDDPQTEKYYKEAVKWVEKAKTYLPNFDEIYLSIYVDALTKIGKEIEAKKIIESALATKPEDPALNLRKATLLRSDPSRLEEALECARIAKNGGAERAYPVEADILIAKKHYHEALTVMDEMDKRGRRLNKRDKMIADTIRARAHTELGHYERADYLLRPYSNEADPFVFDRLIINETEWADNAINKQDYNTARQHVENAEQLLKKFKGKFPHHQRFTDLRSIISQLKARVSSLNRK